MEISFLTIKKENKDFEKHVKSANKIWSKVFGNKYEEDECTGDILVIGSIDNKPGCTVSHMTDSRVSKDSDTTLSRLYVLLS